jgi:hypothetical protein
MNAEGKNLEPLGFWNRRKRRERRPERLRGRVGLVVTSSEWFRLTGERAGLEVC